jgi:hypothetical protein
MGLIPIDENGRPTLKSGTEEVQLFEVPPTNWWFNFNIDSVNAITDVSYNLDDSEYFVSPFVGNATFVPDHNGIANQATSNSGVWIGVSPNLNIDINSGMSYSIGGWFRGVGEVLDWKNAENNRHNTFFLTIDSIYFTYYPTIGDQEQFIYTGITIDTTTWNSLILTYDSNYFKFYYNSNLLYTSPSVNDFSKISSDLRIGYILSDFFIYHTCLTPEEIQTIYLST